MTIKLLVVRITSFTFLVCPHYTGNRFSCRHENVSGSMNDNRIELEQIVHTHRTSHQSGRLAERSVWWTKSQSSLLKIYFHITGSQPTLVPTHFTWKPVHTVAETYLGDMWRSTFKDRRWRSAVSLLSRSSRKFTALLHELTKAKSGIIFVSVQGLSGIVWLIIAFRVPQTPHNLPHNSVATIQCYERLNRLD